MRLEQKRNRSKDKEVSKRYFVFKWTCMALLFICILKDNTQVDVSVFVSVIVAIFVTTEMRKKLIQVNNVIQ